MLAALFEHLFTAHTESDVQKAIAFAKEENIPLLPVGSMSNILFPDSAMNMLLLKIGSGEIRERDGLVRVSAGMPFDDFILWSIKRGYVGLEKLSWIPGTVGAAPIQNIGAYGNEVSSSVVAVEVVDSVQGECRTLSPEACGFGYRKSIFNTNEQGRYIITAVHFSLARGDVGLCKKIREDIFHTRQKKGHLTPPHGPMSVGSFFKNTFVSKETFLKLREMHCRGRVVLGARRWV